MTVEKMTTFEVEIKAPKPLTSSQMMDIVHAVQKRITGRGIRVSTEDGKGKMIIRVETDVTRWDGEQV